MWHTVYVIYEPVLSHMAAGEHPNTSANYKYLLWTAHSENRNRKVTYICTKETYICAKRDLYMHKRDLHMRKIWHSQRKVVAKQERRLTYAQERHIYAQKRPIYAQKRPTYAQKRPAYRLATGETFKLSSHCYNTLYKRKTIYGVALICRLLKIPGLFCKRALYKRLYSAKETYDLKEKTNRSHPIADFLMSHVTQVKNVTQVNSCGTPHEFIYSCESCG